MSIVEILNSQLHPDITNIIFDYNMPIKEDVKLLKLCCCQKIESMFNFEYLGRKITRKYYNVLFINREKNIKQFKLYHKTKQTFNNLIECFHFIAFEPEEKCEVHGNGLDAYFQRQANSEIIKFINYDDKSINKNNDIMQKIYNIYLNITKS